MVGQLSKLLERDSLRKYNMGKRKRKKRKGRGTYNKRQFHSIVCQHCGLCSIYNPKFCYENVYRQDPDRFMAYCYNKLICVSYSLKSKGSPPKDLGVDEFREIFCHSGICANEAEIYCEHTLPCFGSFKKQIFGTEGPLKRFKNKLRSGDKEYIYKAYPTFFTSDDNKWKAKVKEILEGDNRDREQNQSAGSSK